MAPAAAWDPLKQKPLKRHGTAAPPEAEVFNLYCRSSSFDQTAGRGLTLGRPPPAERRADSPLPHPMPCFIKPETFRQPYAMMHSHLTPHRAWVAAAACCCWKPPTSPAPRP
jgi:hypothetical protein